MKKQDQKTAETAPVIAPAPTVVLYSLSPKAAELAAQGGGKTLQYPKKDHGLGKNWRTANYTANNTRAASLAVIAAECPAQFTLEQARAAWAKAGAAAGFHGSATPGSRIKAFTKNGYFAPVATPAE